MDWKFEVTKKTIGMDAVFKIPLLFGLFRPEYNFLTIKRSILLNCI